MLWNKRALKRSYRDLRPIRMNARTQSSISNPSSKTRSPVINRTRSVPSSSKVPCVSSLDHDVSIAGNTFLSGVDRNGIRAQNNLASRIRGTSATIQKYQNAYHIFNKEALVYQCKYFKLNYYPPEHFLGLFRKTKPAITVKESGEAPFNNNLPTGTNTYWGIFRNNPSFLPRNYAVYRRQNRMFIKKYMVEEWCRLHGDEAIAETLKVPSKFPSKYLDRLGRTKQGIAKDGFYVYMSLIFPDETNKDSLAYHIKQSVATVANLQWNKFLQSNRDKNKTWVKKANNCLKPILVKKRLFPGEHARALSRFNRNILKE